MFRVRSQWFGFGADGLGSESMVRVRSRCFGFGVNGSDGYVRIRSRVVIMVVLSDAMRVHVCRRLQMSFASDVTRSEWRGATCNRALLSTR